MEDGAAEAVGQGTRQLNVNETGPVWAEGGEDGGRGAEVFII